MSSVFVISLGMFGLFSLTFAGIVIAVLIQKRNRELRTRQILGKMK